MRKGERLLPRHSMPMPLLSFLLAGLLLLGAPVAKGQGVPDSPDRQNPDSANQSGSAVGHPPASLAPTPSTRRRWSNATLASNPSSPPLGDYVPCLFDKNEELGMRTLQLPPATPPIIDDSAATRIHSATINAIADLGSKPEYNPQAVDDFLRAYVSHIDPMKDLVGKTPAQAYARIQQALLDAKADTDKKWQAANFPGFLAPPSQDVNAAADGVVRVINQAATNVTKQKGFPTNSLDDVWARQLADPTVAAVTQLEKAPNYNSDAVQQFLDA